MLAGLKAQDDRAVITVGGKLLSIEQQTFRGNDNNEIIAGSDDNDSCCFGDQLTGASILPVRLGTDRIVDFTKGQDKIVLSKSTFTAITSAVDGSIGTNFATVANDTLAGGSVAAIVYSLGSGNLFYNQNGTATGLGSGLNFATLTGLPVLATNDF